MAGQPQDGGVNLFLSWSLVEWAMGALGTMTVSTGLWLLRLNSRVDRLETETKVMKGLIRDFAENLNDRIETTEAELKEKMDHLEEKVDDLPTRAFIEAQTSNLGSRIDRLYDRRQA